MAPDGGRGGKMGNFPNIDFENAESVRRAAMSGDICLWFSDALAVKYAENLRIRYDNAKTLVEKNDIYGETEAVLALYSICAYYIYPNSKEFKKKIAANKEYKQNFSRIKDWLDKNGGKKMVDDFFKRIAETHAGRNEAN